MAVVVEYESQLELRGFWHPVAWVEELRDDPYPTTLLGESLVIWRSGGLAVAAIDRCPHRGTALSLGKVENQQLVCAYHGWRYDSGGSCRAIPQSADGSPIPRGARVETFPCEERYGIVWVALESPQFEIPAFPEWDDPTFRHVACPSFTWAASAGRMVENFTDFGHLGYLHDGLLGMHDSLVVPSHTVQRSGGELHYDISMEVPNTNDRLPVTDVSGTRGFQTNTYVLSLPYAIHLRCRFHDSGKDRTLFFASQPRSATESTGYCYQSRNFDLSAEDKPFADFQELLAEQDRPIVESQEPHSLPLEATAELQLPFDRVAIAYRRALGELASERRPEERRRLRPGRKKTVSA